MQKYLIVVSIYKMVVNYLTLLFGLSNLMTSPQTSKWSKYYLQPTRKQKRDQKKKKRKQIYQRR